MRALTNQARRGRTTAALIAVLGLMAALLVPSAAASAATSEPAPAPHAVAAASTAPFISQEVTDAVAAGGSAFVIANLAAPANAPQAIESTAQSVLDQLPEGSYEGEAKAQAVPFVAVKVDEAGLEGLRTDSSVTSVVLNHMNTESLVQSVPAIGGDTPRSAGVDGAGTAVAILDVGVQADHPFLSDGVGHSRVVSEACFSGLGNNLPNVFSLCPSGDATQMGPGSAAPCPLSASSACGHGTHVAGIAAGGLATNNGTSQPKYGVAPKASIVAANVFSLYCAALPDPDLNCLDAKGWQLTAFDSDIALALNWVDQYRYSWNLAAVNLSVGSATTYAGTCDAVTSLTTPIQTLKDHGVATVVASGNSGSKTGISSPACTSGAISVGSWDTGTSSVSGFSNSSSQLTMLAPGARNGGGVVSSYPTSTYAPLMGTSMAAPHVTGAIALLHQANPGENVDILQNRLTSTGTAKLDTNGISRPLINVNLALRTAPQIVVDTMAVPPYPGSRITPGLTVRGYPTPTRAYQWYRCSTWSPSGTGAPPGTCTPIAGETASSYVISVDDIDSFIAVGITGTNGVGSPAVIYQFLPDRVPNLPAQPAAPTMATGFGYVTATWAPAWPDGLPITGYRVVLYGDGTTTTVDAPAGTTSYKFTNLSSEVVYSVTVAQRNVNGLGPASPGGLGAPTGLPGAPPVIGASPHDGAVAVSWGSMTTGNLATLGYLVTASPGGATCSAAPPAGSCTVTGLANGTPYTFTVKAQNANGFGPSSAPSSPVTPVAGYHSITPTRYLDTRASAQGGGGTFDGANSGAGAIPSGQTITLKVAGRGPVPADATAVALNVTVAGSTGGGYLTVYESGVNAPLASNLNFYPGQVVPNMVISKIGTNGEIAIKNVGGSTPIVVDVVGYFAAGSLYTPLVPARLMDTRTPAEGAQSVDGAFVNTGPIPSGGTRTLTVAGRGGVPASGVGAVALNVTVAGSTGGGYVTVYESGVNAPLASNLNFYPNQIVPNMVVTKVGADGKIVIKNVGGSTPIIVDVVGWFPTDPGGLTPLVPARLMDTRPVHQGAATVDGGFVGTGWFFDGTIRTLPVTGRGGVPAEGVSAVVLNVTVAGSTGGGYLSVYQSGVSAPLASNLNFYPGQVVPNMVIAKVGADGSIAIKNVGGSTDIVVDVVGWFP